MSRFAARRPGPTVLGTAVLSVGLLAGSLTAHDAHAEIVGCRTDPVVLLSNGTELDLSAAIDDSSADVQQVTFALHVPTGVRVIAYVEGSLGAKESWQAYGDNTAGNYDVITTARTATPGAGVQATTQALGLIGVTLITVGGQANQPLSVHFSL
jgi:hypothetical protein